MNKNYDDAQCRKLMSNLGGNLSGRYFLFRSVTKQNPKQQTTTIQTNGFLKSKSGLLQPETLNPFCTLEIQTKEIAQPKDC